MQIKEQTGKYRKILNEQIICNIRLKSKEDLEDAVYYLQKHIQNAAWSSTPTTKQSSRAPDCSRRIKEMILKKRKLRKQWQISRAPRDKKRLNKAAKDLKNILEKK